MGKKKGLKPSEVSVGVIGATLGLTDLEFRSVAHLVSCLPLYSSLPMELEREKEGKYEGAAEREEPPRMDVVKEDNDGGI